ncbi:MAG: hypothetical protein H7A51_13810 [Akkermansiaceae bacterium]|nr:hypothetical protein [Akkermansiaceae bacterium]MCP5537292.1 hypothetical protein [Akkermansiaceae bacterium]
MKTYTTIILIALMTICNAGETVKWNAIAAKLVGTWGEGKFVLHKNTPKDTPIPNVTFELIIRPDGTATMTAGKDGVKGAASEHRYAISKDIIVLYDLKNQTSDWTNTFKWRIRNEKLELDFLSNIGATLVLKKVAEQGGASDR